MKGMKRLVIGVVVATIVMVMCTSTIALAHNAGHIHLPTGECVDVGSGKHAPTENQDKIPGPGDQYGARWAADQGNTPIYPRHCDEEGAHNHP